MTFKVGSCAVVLARKYVAILGGLIGLILLAYVFRATASGTGKEVPRGPDSPRTWEDFLMDCGPKSHLGPKASAMRVFQEKYYKKTLKWQGEVRQIREGVDIFFWHTKSVLLVRMHPTRYPTRDYPDIALLFGEERNKDVANFAPGDWIEFEATMSVHGRRGEPEVMTLWGARAAKKPDNLPADEIVHSTKAPYSAKTAHNTGRGRHTTPAPQKLTTTVVKAAERGQDV